MSNNITRAFKNAGAKLISVDAEMVSKTRFDQHKNANDCLHFLGRNTEVYKTWVEVVLNVLKATQVVRS